MRIDSFIRVVDETIRPLLYNKLHMLAAGPPSSSFLMAAPSSATNVASWNYLYCNRDETGKEHTKYSRPYNVVAFCLRPKPPTDISLVLIQRALENPRYDSKEYHVVSASVTETDLGILYYGRPDTTLHTCDRAVSVFLAEAYRETAMSYVTAKICPILFTCMLEDDTYASANVMRKQTKRLSKWLPEEFRTQVLGAVTRTEGVEWSALKPVDVKLLHCTPCAPWDGYQLVHSDHNLMGPPWMKDCIQVFIPLDNVPAECALQVGVGSHQVGQHESNRWDVCSMELGDILLLKGCTFHRGAGGGEKGRYTLFIPFVPLEHAATMSKVHLARQLYALPPRVQFLKDAKGVPIPWESFTHFSAPLLVRRRQAIPYCGDVVILGHGVQGATFFFKCPPGPEEPPCPLARFHRVTSRRQVLTAGHGLRLRKVRWCSRLPRVVTC